MSKTPRVSDAVTVSVPSGFYRKLVLIFVATFCLFLSVILFQTTPHRLLTVDDNILKLETVRSVEDKQTGLSGRSNMPSDRGMLFVFDSPSSQCFWMKDMKFSIDILWLDQNKEIVAIEQFVDPSTYPGRFCYDEAMYVIELNAGTTEALGLKTGDQLAF